MTHKVVTCFDSGHSKECTNLPTRISLSSTSVSSKITYLSVPVHCKLMKFLEIFHEMFL